MALPRVYRVVQDQQGNIVPQVLGSVYNQGTGVLASLYQDDAGTVPLSNPMTSDAQYGSFKFHINPGHYDLTFTKPGYTFEPIMDFQVPDDNVTLGSMATQNADAVAITGGTAALTSLGIAVPTPVAGIDLQPQTPVGIQVRNFSIGGQSQAFVGQVALGANQWNLYLSGTAQNYLAGSLGIGVPGGVPSYPLHVEGAIYGTTILGLGTPPLLDRKLAMTYDKNTQHAIAAQQTSDTGGAVALLLVNAAGTTIGSISTTASATAYNTSSDTRLKEGIAALVGALDVITALNPVSFRWQADGSKGIGFLAHELMRVVPEAVSGLPDAVNPDGTIRPQQVDHSRLLPWAVAGMKDLLAQVEALTARVTALETALGV